MRGVTVEVAARPGGVVRFMVQVGGPFGRSFAWELCSFACVQLAKVIVDRAEQAEAMPAASVPGGDA